MKNTFKIFWSDEALRNLDNIINYLAFRWTQKEVSNFLFDLNNLILTIKESPTLFPLSQKNQVRRAVLSKQTTIYYHVDKNLITIISLFDNRQNPNKKNY